MFTTPGPLDLVAIAREVRAHWDRTQVFAQLAARNRGRARHSARST